MDQRGGGGEGRIDRAENSSTAGAKVGRRGSASNSAVVQKTLRGGGGLEPSQIGVGNLAFQFGRQIYQSPPPPLYVS